MGDFDLLNLFQGIATLVAADTPILVMRLFLIALGILLIALGIWLLYQVLSGATQLT